jgi:cytidine deaminase
MSSDPLIAAAADARTRAFAPFSRFQVGAALEAEDGTVVVGCNVESASYGLTVCAERVAVFAGVARGFRCFRRVAVVTDAPTPTPPCGACRQILWEFAPDAEVVMANLAGEVRKSTIRELLPGAFDARQLGEPPPEVAGT